MRYIEMPYGPGRWPAIAAYIMVAGPLPGAGMLWVFDDWDSRWWPIAANDSR